MKVIAAVPNYNMRQNLKSLLNALLAEKLEAVFLLDDASTDGSVEYVETNFPAVKVVRGQKNVGAGANRNRVISELVGDELILFLDADLDLRTIDLASVVKGWFSDDRVGLVGGQILAKTGKPMYWNYGPEMNPIHDYRVEVYDAVKASARIDSKAFKTVREMALTNEDTYNFEIQYGKPASRRVDWVAEGLFAVTRVGMSLELDSICITRSIGA